MNDIPPDLRIEFDDTACVSSAQDAAGHLGPKLETSRAFRTGWRLKRWIHEHRPTRAIEQMRLFDPEGCDLGDAALPRSLAGRYCLVGLDPDRRITPETKLEWLLEEKADDQDWTVTGALNTSADRAILSAYETEIDHFDASDSFYNWIYDLGTLREVLVGNLIDQRVVFHPEDPYRIFMTDRGTEEIIELVLSPLG